MTSRKLLLVGAAILGLSALSSSAWAEKFEDCVTLCLADSESNAATCEAQEYASCPPGETKASQECRTAKHNQCQAIEEAADLGCTHRCYVETKSPDSVPLHIAKRADLEPLVNSPCLLNCFSDDLDRAARCEQVWIGKFWGTTKGCPPAGKPGAEICGPNSPKYPQVSCRSQELVASLGCSVVCLPSMPVASMTAITKERFENPNVSICLLSCTSDDATRQRACETQGDGACPAVGSTLGDMCRKDTERVKYCKTLEFASNEFCALRCLSPK